MSDDQSEAIKAAVLAERQRCYDIVLEAPYLMKGRMAMACKELAFDITSRIRSGEAPTILQFGAHGGALEVDLGRAQQEGK
jgi:ApbE superfamily uncharacterized protein (UPF0280 family)